MKRTPIAISPEHYPALFRPLLRGAEVFDSSCSPEARVLLIERDGGCFLKSAPRGTLATEAKMGRYFHKLGLSGAVLEYLSDEQDWLLTERVVGEDCTHATYLSDPVRLCDLLAERLRMLHEFRAEDCPVKDRMGSYLATVEENFANGVYDASFYEQTYGVASKDALISLVREHRSALKNDTLLHGDYCLPNIILRDWRFSGLIDLGGAGLGDRHVDLFWGAWSLCFNLKTDRYRARFFDAYGRECITPELLRVVAAAEVFG